MALSASRVSARCTAGIGAVSTSSLSTAISAASSAPASDSHFATRDATACASASEAAAAPRVAPTTRRIPFAVPSSDITTKRSAAFVLARCVPPQNSMENAFQSSLEGFASKSSILGPTETTRTGSGYTSPNTALNPEIFCASASLTSRASTSNAFSICALTIASTAVNCSTVIALLCEKSKRSFSSSTSEPFWSTPSPSTWRSAKFKTCVIVWLGITRRRRSWSTSASQASPTFKTPSTLSAT
mmetsp:Transcript_11854/g.50769  ORF Transcript_11854/g.50769 Transcript_11854/m.50769 type:complete len:244 (+) Transcript_11854:624-1355(+)